jgi:tripartite-type tricarboxylate transporter receptor subunit TctC
MIGATMIEKGYTTIEANPWFVFFLRVGTPASILTRLARAFREAIQDSEIAAKIERSSVEIESRSPAGDSKMLVAFNKKRGEAARTTNIVAE